MKIENISKAFGEKVVMDGFSLDVKPCTITCLLGPSGCGKTTLLNICAGLDSPDSGTISYDESESGNISYLFQEPRLLPWRTALENVAIALGNDREKASHYLGMVGLKDDMDKYPSQLSGGMRQRVAIARAFSYPSRTILIDEPFQGVDIAMRNSLAKTFLNLWEENRKTVLWVTHDINEACLAADQVVVLTSKPMKVKTLRTIDVPRAQRNATGMAALQAEIYQSLI